MRKLITTPSGEFDFSNFKKLPEYKLRWLQDVQSQAREQNKEIPQNVLELMMTSYEHGFTDGGNAVLRVIGMTGKDMQES
jgi:hypothetical protein